MASVYLKRISDLKMELNLFRFMPHFAVGKALIQQPEHP